MVYDSQLSNSQGAAINLRSSTIPIAFCSRESHRRLVFPRLHSWVRQTLLAWLNRKYLGDRLRRFLCHPATVSQKIVYVMLDMLKVNFLQIPSMFTTILHKKALLLITVPKVQITTPYSCNIANGECLRLVKVIWQMSPFLILCRHKGLYLMQYRTSSKECNNYVTYRYTP